MQQLASWNGAAAWFPRWVVEGFNNSDTDLVVRPWVTCAAVND